MEVGGWKGGLTVVPGVVAEDFVGVLEVAGAELEGVGAFECIGRVVAPLEGDLGWLHVCGYVLDVGEAESGRLGRRLRIWRVCRLARQVEGRRRAGDVRWWGFSDWVSRCEHDCG